MIYSWDIFVILVLFSLQLNEMRQWNVVFIYIQIFIYTGWPANAHLL